MTDKDLSKAHRQLVQLMADPEQRLQNYGQHFAPALKVYNGRIYGVWVLGNSYQNKSAFYGEFPHSVLERIMALFPDKRKVLHLFSGTLKGNGKTIITYDISKKFKPTICDHVKNLRKYIELLQDCDLVICDPPYEKKDFEIYGVEPFNKAQVIRDLAAILKKGAHVAWLDTTKPMYRKSEWFLLGEIMVSVSTNHRYRGLCLFERV